MTQDHGTSPLRDDRAVVNGAASVSALRASVPSAGDVFEIIYPFVQDTYSGFDGEGYSALPTWKPGINFVHVSEDHTAAVADDIGHAIFTVVEVFKPGRFPTRVFYTRQFVSPSGHRFGKSRLHIATLEKFRRLTRGYQHPFGVGAPLPSEHQWWRKGDISREFAEMLAAEVAKKSAVEAGDAQP